MEEESEALLRRLLPKSWVMHTYKPDYGIDFVIEIFDDLEDNDKVYQTAGELFYVQLKAVKQVDKVVTKKYPRMNVEKFARAITSEDDPCLIEVIKFTLDVRLINTVLLMGNATPVLLLVCDLENEEIYFVCLNDYAEKILYPEKPSFTTQTTVTLDIPTSNILKKRDDENLAILKLYGSRAKLYAAFAKFSYQNHEIIYADSFSLLSRFLEIISRYDFWKKIHIWYPIGQTYEKLGKMKMLLENLRDRKSVV